MSILLLTRPQPPGLFAPGLRAELPGEAMWEEAAAATEADVLVCTLPRTPATHGLLDRETLQKLPRGAWVINVARGGHLIEPDLLALLDNGHLAGAALDVQAVEPLAPESPLWDHPRVTLTPAHRGPGQCRQRRHAIRRQLEAIPGGTVAA